MLDERAGVEHDHFFGGVTVFPADGVVAKTLSFIRNEVVIASRVGWRCFPARRLIDVLTGNPIIEVGRNKIVRVSLVHSGINQIVFGRHPRTRFQRVSLNLPPRLCRELLGKL
ncbi:MAG: hypothetical protein M3348_17240, partial [Acidobacteriota bacterium]|nr:hypothetical protein [Acidobacteriota bacterium]